MSHSDKVDAVSLMKDSLPEYVVNCFLAAGYDVTEVIAAMDVSENPGNSIESIENYISELNAIQKILDTAIILIVILPVAQSRLSFHQSTKSAYATLSLN